MDEFPYFLLTWARARMIRNYIVHSQFYVKLR